MLENYNQYLNTIDKIADLKKYLTHVENFPVADKVIQKAMEQGPQSLIDEMEEECIEYVQSENKKVSEKLLKAKS